MLAWIVLLSFAFFLFLWEHHIFLLRSLALFRRSFAALFINNRFFVNLCYYISFFFEFFFEAIFLVIDNYVFDHFLFLLLNFSLLFSFNLSVIFIFPPHWNMPDNYSFKSVGDDSIQYDYYKSGQSESHWDVRFKFEELCHETIIWQDHIGICSKKNDNWKREPEVWVQRLSEGLADAENHTGKEVLEVWYKDQGCVLVTSKVCLVVFWVNYQRFVKWGPVSYIEEHKDLKSKLNDNGAKYRG